MDILFGKGTIIRHSFIGTDVSGAVAGNIGDGVRIEGGASQATITSNKICFNTGIGIDIISGSNNSVSGNVVCDNGGDGIDIDGGTGNNLSGNAIYDNGGLGIDLGGDGVTPNDYQDPDTGPNNLQNYPILTSAVLYPDGLVILGSLNSTPNSFNPFAVEFFGNSTYDASGFGEGEKPIGVALVFTDRNGDGPFTFSLFWDPPAPPATARNSRRARRSTAPWG